MRTPGIIGTLQLAGTLVFALPLFLFGLTWVVDGRPVGFAFVAVAVLMVALQRYLTNPLDPGDVAESAVEYVTDEER